MYQYLHNDSGKEALRARGRNGQAIGLMPRIGDDPATYVLWGGVGGYQASPW